MSTIPTPRTPKCVKHHVHLASCLDCQAEMHAAREEATKRLERATR